MSNNDLFRSIGSLRGDAKALRKLTLLWRRVADNTETTGELCARKARDPLRRLEPLRRRAEGAQRLQ